MKQKDMSYVVKGKEIDMSLEVAALRKEVQQHLKNPAKLQDPVAQTQILSQEDLVTHIASVTHISSQEKHITHIVSATHIAPQEDPVTHIASDTYISSQEDPVTHVVSNAHISSQEHHVAGENSSLIRSQQAGPATEATSLDHSMMAAPRRSDCVVCLTRRSRIALIPCGHKCVCQDCLQVLRDANACCPICRHQITDAIQVFD